MSNNTKIVVFDIETSPLIITKFQYDRNPFINPDSIEEDWFIISAAWKVVGEKKVHSVAIKNVFDDYEVVKTLRDALSEADVIVGHCIDRFDIRNLTARLIYHKLDPLPKIPTVDTKKEAKKIAGFSSNKLDYLSKFLTGKGKIETNYSLWKDVLKGSKKALKEMVEYNKVDVIRNEEVYLRLRPYMKTHPHKGVIDGEDKTCSCQKCGSTKVKKNGIRITAAGHKRQEIQCRSCGSYGQVPYKVVV